MIAFVYLQPRPGRLLPKFPGALGFLPAPPTTITCRNSSEFSTSGAGLYMIVTRQQTEAEDAETRRRGDFARLKSASRNRACPKRIRNADFSPQDRRVDGDFCGLKS